MGISPETWVGITPKPKGQPKTISELLDRNVRGNLNTELYPYELREEETSFVMSIGSDGKPIIDNSPEIELLKWVESNAILRNIKPQYPRKIYDGD